MVIGSKDSLIEKIKVHYDPSLTRPGAPVDYLANEIEGAVMVDELSAFFSTLFSELKCEDAVFTDIEGTKYFRFYNFADRTLRVANAVVQKACRDFLSADEKRAINFLRKHHSHVDILSNRPTLVRKIWHGKLFKDGKNDISLFVSLVSSSLVSSSDYSEIFETVYSRITTFHSSDHEDNVLKQIGFYDFIKSKVTGGLLNSFDDANSKAELILRLLNAIPIDREIASKIYDGFNYSNYPWKVAKSLREFFKNRPDKKQEYLAHVNEADGIGIPTHIESLSEDKDLL